MLLLLAESYLAMGSVNAKQVHVITGWQTADVYV